MVTQDVVDQANIASVNLPKDYLDLVSFCSRCDEPVPLGLTCPICRNTTQYLAPTLDQIREKCKRIQASWSPRQEMKHRDVDPDVERDVIPKCKLVRRSPRSNGDE